MSQDIASTINFDAIPGELKEHQQWVLWREEKNDKGRSTKLPKTISGFNASSTDAKTWNTFDNVVERFSISDIFNGVGFVFSPNDPYCGIDLDGCRNPVTGEVADWALGWIDQFHSYTEVSPSKTGVKIFCKGKFPRETGGKKELDVPKVSDKNPAIEVYDHARYFTMTGLHLAGTPLEVNAPSPAVFSELVSKYFTTSKTSSSGLPTGPTRSELVERCWKYVQKMPDAISGSGGHDATFSAACECFRFGLTDSEAAEVMWRFNDTKTGDEPWNDKELQHKLDSGRNEVTSKGEFGIRLRDDRPVKATQKTSSAPTSGDSSSNGESVEQVPEFARLLSSADLCDMDLRPNFYVKGIVVAGQPLVIGGPSKTLKTSVTVDLVLSLATGTPFLGRFDATQQKVAFWSGESGAATIRNSALRVAKAKDINLRDAGVLWSFVTPKLSNAEHLIHFERVIAENEIKVVVIDPLYLALLNSSTAGNAGNLYAMGAALQPLAEIGQRTGATLVLLHHFKKGVAEDSEPAGLEMLSQSGIAEWARQWLLLQRRTPYQMDGKHELWMRTGGSAGHCGLWGLDVDEGMLDEETNDGRYWSVAVNTIGDARKNAEESAQQRRENQQAEKDADDKRKLLVLLRNLGEPETKSVIRDTSGLTTARFGKALTTLIGEGRCKLVTVTKHNRQETGYQFCEPSNSGGRERSGSGRENSAFPTVECRSGKAPIGGFPTRPTDGSETGRSGNEKNFPTEPADSNGFDFKQALVDFNDEAIA